MMLKKKLKFAIERKINSLRKEVHALKLASSVEEAERFEIELSVENENRALRHSSYGLTTQRNEETCGRVAPKSGCFKGRDER